MFLAQPELTDKGHNEEGCQTGVDTDEEVTAIPQDYAGVDVRKATPSSISMRKVERKRS